LEGQDAGIVAFPFDLDAGRGEDPHDRLRDLRADAITRNQRDDVSHQRDSAIRSASSAATDSSSAWSSGPNAARRSLSMSISPSTSVPCMIGTTISERVSRLHARYRGSEL